MEKEEKIKEKAFFTEGDLEQTSGWAACAAVLIACCFGWDYALVTAFAIVFVALCCKRQYNKGKFDPVVDEYEQEGYPEAGWRQMNKSLKKLEIIALIAVIVVSVVKLILK
jgi:hypothetical protein